jgi:hypothetical protein
MAGAQNFKAEKIMSEILFETKNYNDAIKNNKKFSEVRTIRLKIKELTKKSEELLTEKNVNSTKQDVD